MKTNSNAEKLAFVRDALEDLLELCEDRGFGEAAEAIVDILETLHEDEELDDYPDEDRLL